MCGIMLFLREEESLVGILWQFVALLFQFEQKPVISLPPVPTDLGYVIGILFLMEIKGLTFFL